MPSNSRLSIINPSNGSPIHICINSKISTLMLLADSKKDRFCDFSELKCVANANSKKPFKRRNTILSSKLININAMISFAEKHLQRGYEKACPKCLASCTDIKFTTQVTYTAYLENHPPPIVEGYLSINDC
jgi:hypothetical protein